MGDSVIFKITKNLRDSLHRQPITYNGITYETTAECQRLITNIGNRYPYIEVCGPWPQTEWRGNNSVSAKLWYRIEMYENTISDSFSGDIESIPITEMMGNVGADLVMLIMADITRGGNAIITRCEMPGYYFTGDPAAPEFVIYTDVCVETFINQSNPYITGV